MDTQIYFPLGCNTESSCPTPTEHICGAHGGFVTAIAFMDAHYQLRPEGCNSQVVVPWIYLVRFAAEITFQSCTRAIDKSAGITSSHDFNSHYQCWHTALVTGHPAHVKTNLKTSAKRCKDYFEPIDAIDTRGLSFRYPMGNMELDPPQPPLPADLTEHCSWPLKLRKLIATVCDLTIKRLGETAENRECVNAIRSLRKAAAAGECQGDYDPRITIQPYDEHLVSDISLFTDPPRERCGACGHDVGSREMGLCSEEIAGIAIDVLSNIDLDIAPSASAAIERAIERRFSGELQSQTQPLIR